MSHPSFSYEHPLPSLRVTKDFLASLEQYLMKKVIDSSLVTSEEAQTCLRIKIDDSYGSERLDSVSQASGTRFSDSTSQVEVEVNTPYRGDGTKLRIRLNFARGRLFSTVAISATAPNAKELVLTLKDGIFRILDPQRTWHWLCHPNAQAWASIFGVGVVLVVALVQSDGKGSTFPYLFAAAIFAWLYLFQFASLRLYTVFDTRAAERSDKVWTWLITGICTFALFGTLAVLVRRHFLGF